MGREEKLHKNGTVMVATLLDQVKVLSDALENTSQAFGADYPDGRLMTCNKAFCDLTGYTKEELLNRLTWSKSLTPPEWREFESGILEKLNRTGEPQRYEKEYVRKDGSRVPVEVFIHQALDDEGNVLYYYSFITDITERKRSEATLKKYRVMFDATQDMLFMINPDGKILEVNATACKSYGYTMGELLKMNARDLRTPDRRAEMAGQLERCFEGPSTFETMHQRKDGSTFPVEIGNKGFVMDGQKVIVGIVRDITDRKRAEETLLESEERFRAYMSNSPAIAWMKDSQGRYVHTRKSSEFDRRIG
jgi:PAS domain S-box-containing protein